MEACSALQGLARISDDVLADVLAAGSLELVIGAMRAHLADPCVQMAGCYALGGIAESCESFETALRTDSAMEQIIAAMEKHPENASVQPSAIQALERLSRHGGAELKQIGIISVFNNPQGHDLRMGRITEADLTTMWCATCGAHASVPLPLKKPCRGKAFNSGQLWLRSSKNRSMTHRLSHRL